ncbi:hypothetical protein MNBD_GAMMA10-2875 [hydrothermal vent metagenome]|uniref:Inosine/uridine-preferring nucleoside hydrolase domain-containing protein n=1 Tax=hydrothermal vent metagenome TaxID=652676 RepID=A0A3B0Y1G2_9ZZZZ
MTLFAIGPFTDIACLRRAYPEVYGKVKEIIGLVGSLDGEPVINNTQVVDFNFAMDPTALGLVIQNSPVPVTFILFEVSQLGSLTLDSLQAWQRSASQMQQYYGSASIPHAEYWNEVFDISSGQALFDAHTVYYFLNPDLYLCEDNMLATANINNYPDLNAKTSGNTLVVESQANIGSVGEAVTGNSISGFVRACYGFKNAQSVQQFEQAVKSSIM